MTDYEVKLYKPGRDAAFAESGIANEFRPAFNDAYEESYEEFMRGIEEIDELPEPHMRQGKLRELKKVTTYEKGNRWLTRHPTLSSLDPQSPLPLLVLPPPKTACARKTNAQELTWAEGR